ncbi:YdcF family protein [Gilvimarinus sp. 1_MG-2023]|uniref:YdcF family protein n=1 Tax=Gilvimarinus sp. 1_MG-2023 TaxID=3062638 RepID=UPI0026E43115|nr:YdcF family protein [Gilvimarinus sp. 1_MG-2023]MDO6747594.1 YdcF family protein [Gilvimarinus sp. 1_MG-2023]
MSETRDAIGKFLFVADTKQLVDLVIVAASPSISSIQPAIEMYKEGLTPRIVISGAGIMTSGVLEWQGYRDHALAHGVAEADLLLEKHATNTKENMIFTSALVASSTGGWDDIHKVALCAKPFHMRRVLMTACQHLPSHLRFVSIPPNDPGDIARDTWWQSEYGRKRVLEELGRISTYAMKGDLGGF